MLKAITAQYVMLRKGAPERYAQQREIVTELTHLLMLGAPATLEPMFAEWFGQARTTPAGCGRSSTRWRRSPTRPPWRCSARSAAGEGGR